MKKRTANRFVRAAVGKFYVPYTVATKSWTAPDSRPQHCSPELLAAKPHCIVIFTEGEKYKRSFAASTLVVQIRPFVERSEDPPPPSAVKEMLRLDEFELFAFFLTFNTNVMVVVNSRGPVAQLDRAVAF